MDTISNTAQIIKLSDSGLTVTNAAEDIRGRKVLDAAGEEVGEIEDLMIDTVEKKVRFIRVATGGFLGLGETKFLIPIDAITRIGTDQVIIQQTREHIAGAPHYDPDLTEEPDWTSLYGYYGYHPYWGAGYRYPGFPYLF